MSSPGQLDRQRRAQAIRTVIQGLGEHDQAAMISVVQGLLARYADDFEDQLRWRLVTVADLSPEAQRRVAAFEDVISTAVAHSITNLGTEYVGVFSADGTLLGAMSGTRRDVDLPPGLRQRMPPGVGPAIVTHNHPDRLEVRARTASANPGASPQDIDVAAANDVLRIRVVTERRVDEVAAVHGWSVCDLEGLRTDLGHDFHIHLSTANWQRAQYDKAGLVARTWHLHPGTDCRLVHGPERLPERTPEAFAAGAVARLQAITRRWLPLPGRTHGDIVRLLNGQVVPYLDAQSTSRAGRAVVGTAIVAELSQLLDGHQGRLRPSEAAQLAEWCSRVADWPGTLSPDALRASAAGARRQREHQPGPRSPRSTRPLPPEM